VGFCVVSGLVPAAARWRPLALPVAAVTLVAAVAVVAFTPIGSMASSLGSGSSVQSRSTIWRTTSQAISESFPVGTGLGTFEPVYRQYEDPGAVTSEYINHAHNDYLELALELGAAGLVLMVLFIGWWAVAATRIWTSTLSTPFGRAATIASAAILAHSIVDYPLRTGAVMAIFGAAIALMAQRSQSTSESKRNDLRPARHVRLG
jgi:O-antigen ligase